MAMGSGEFFTHPLVGSFRPTRIVLQGVKNMLLAATIV